MKNHFKIKKLPSPVDSQDAVSKSYLDEKVNNQSII